MINSENLSTGIGLLVIEAAIMANKGKSAKEIVEYMIEHHWNEARLQLQMHKFIWPPEQRGV